MNSSLETVYVPAESYSEYVAKFSGYVNNGKIVAVGADEDFTVVDGVLTLYSGEGGEVEIPAGVEKIGQSAFQNCKTVTSVVLNEDLTVIDSRAFSGCTNLESVTFNKGLSKIGNYAFSGCTNLVTVKCSEGLESIGSGAFNNCSKLEEIQLNDALKTIGSYAFSGCVKLGGMIFNEQLETIESYAFNGCTGLKEVVFNGKLKTIGECAFLGCTGITGNLVIPGSVTSIGNYAFSGCTGISGKLTIEGNAEGTTIGNYAFSGCGKISSIELGEGITSIGSYAFRNCNGIKGSLVIPNSVTSLGEYTFYNCSGIETLKLSENLMVINDRTFYGCTNLSGEVVIPDKVTTINYGYAFRECKKITSVVFGESVKFVASDTFYDCSGVKEITFKGTTPPSDGSFMSYMNSSLETVYVPAESYSEYVAKFNSYKNNAVFSTDTLKANIKDFKATARHSSTISLSWSAHQNEKVIGYVVLRNDEIVARTSDCSFVDTGLKGGTYNYTVYGYTADDETTASTSITASTSKPELVKIYTTHLNNTIGLTDNEVRISAKNNLNYKDLDGNEIKGKLYLVKDNGEREFIGSSKLLSGSAATNTLVYTVNWDITDVDEGEYNVVFAIEDIDGASDEVSGKINVNKSVPEQIINVIAVGDFTKINLSWSQSSEVDSTIYRIYRKSEVDSKFSLLKTINGRTTLTFSDTSVKENRKYYYYVVTENSFGITSEPSDVAVAMTAKDTEAPTVTKFTPANNSYITKTATITVTAVDNLMPVKVKLYYSIDEGENWILVGEDVAAPFTFSFDSTEVSDGKIAFKAYAYDAANNESNPMTCVYVVDNTGPEKVTGVSAKAILTSKVTLQWNDVSDNDAACFILQQKTNDGYKTISSSITTLGYNLSNLYPGTEYTYRVAAIDIRGNIGTYSDDFTVTTAIDTTPPVVTSLVPSPSRHNNSIAFKASAGDDSGIQSITIQVSTDKVNWKNISTATYSSYNKTATYAYTISLAGYSDGSIFVRAVASDYSGNLSDTSDSAAFVEYIVDKTAPNKPRDLIASGGDGWIYISWLQGEEEDLSTYQLYRATSENGAYSLIASNLSKISYYDTTAQRDTVYYYKLRVFDTTGNLSDFTEAVSAKVADDIVAPEVVNINPVSGSVVGPSYKLVEALVKDNNCLDSIVFEYKINDEAKFRTLKVIDNIGYYYTTARVDLPIDELVDGDKINIRVRATDIVGLTSEYSSEYTYLVDKVAPTLSNLSVSIENDNSKITWQNAAETDVSGYKVYRCNSDGTFTFLGSRSYSKSNSYTFYDYLYNLGNSDYSYKVEVYDRVGNFNSYFTDPIHYSHETSSGPDEPKVNEAPKAVINGFETMEVGVEEFFDAGYSTDDDGIVSYKWDFGDGTTSDLVKVIKKYKKVGTYTVSLTVTDTDGESTTQTLTVTVNERTAVGTVKVNVVDENGKPVANAPVYFNLGEESQKKVVSNNNGVASLLLEKGDHVVGAYKSGYLPVQKTITVLPNATRVVTMTIIEQEIVTGKFEVTRMTFSEIKAAGIDVYSPANQNVYKVEVQIKYGGSTVPVTYIRNDSKIISYTVGNSGGSSGGSYGGSSGGSGNGSSGSSGGRVISGLTFIPNEENKEIVAVIDMPIEASYLKEFFDVRLHIINNAAPEFKLVDNTVTLAVPDGLTMMSGLSGDWYETPEVHIDSIVGQETKTLSWILRGDEQGEYDLTADFDGTLAVFNENVKATFKTDEPIKVYGLSSMKLNVNVNNEIKYNALYFDFGIENVSDIDIYNPVLDFDGIVSNITASAKQGAAGMDSTKGSANFDVESSLLNVRVEFGDGSTQYVPFTWNSNGTVTTNIDTLSPGDSIYYEYVAYNVVDYDDIARFVDASKNVLSGYSENVEVKYVTMDLFSTKSATEKLDTILGASSTGNKIETTEYDVSKYEYSSSFKSSVTNETRSNKFLYNDCFFEKDATAGVNGGLASASMNLSSSAYKGSSEVTDLLVKMGYRNIVTKNYSSSEIKGKTDSVAYSVAEKKISTNNKTYNAIVVVVRGTPGSYEEWKSNFNIGYGDYHKGFKTAADEVIAFVESYVSGKGYNKDSTKIWITGHSRGAAVANIVAEKLTLDGAVATANNIYGYTFATPATSLSADTSLKNIINYCNNDDIISCVPLEKWGFKRAGVTVKFNMNNASKNIFYGMTEKEYRGNGYISSVLNNLNLLIPDVKTFYSSRMDEVFDVLAKFLAGKAEYDDIVSALVVLLSDIFGITIDDVSKALQEHTNEFIDFVFDFLDLCINISGVSPIFHAHCQETYISYLNATIPRGNIVTTIKKNEGNDIKSFEVSRSNALNYIIDDNNYLYIQNSGLLDEILETGYNALKLATLDLNALTKEDQKKIAKTVLLELITDSSYEDEIDTLVDTTYIDVVKKALDLVKTSTVAVENPSILSAANDILSNKSKINSLASTLKVSGNDGLRSTLIKEFGTELVGGIVLEKLKLEVTDICSDEGLAGCFLECMPLAADFVSGVIDYTLLKPIEIYNDVEYARQINAVLKLYASNNVANLILDTIISSEKSDSLVDILLEHAFMAINPSYLIYKSDQKLKTDIKKIVISTAKEMKSEMNKAFKGEVEAIKSITESAIKSGITTLLQNEIKSLLGPAYIWYVLFSSTFKLVDKGFGLSAYYKNVDTFNIITYISSSLLVGFYVHTEAYSNNDLSVIINDYRKEYDGDTAKRDIALDSLYILKALCNSRLIGEQAYKVAVEANNATLLKGDAEYDYGILQAANSKFNTSYSTIEEVYDYIYANILKARDAIFNVEEKTDVEKPEAPTVTFNYDTLSTNESFDDTFEYCLSNGEWVRCNGNPISVKLKTNSTVLRVRKASGRKSVAGEITTLNLYAKREFSKVVSVRYDNGTYYFNNLLSVYKYQISPVDSANATIDWSNSKIFDGESDAKVNFEFGKYLAIRTCANAELKETVSQTRIIPVSVKQTLTINTWGNGKVEQTDNTGKYFIGDDVKLKAIADDGAIFKGWYIDGELVSKDAEYMLEMYNFADITAKFEGGETVEAKDVDLVLSDVSDEYVSTGFAAKTKSLFNAKTATKVYEGSVAKLSANVSPSNASDKSIQWTSSDDTVATVDENGLIKFVSDGTVTIAATLNNGISSTYDFEVLSNDIVEFYIAESANKVQYYEYEALDLSGLKAIVKYTNGATEEVANYFVEGFNNVVGNKTITINYQGFSDSFEVSTIHKTKWVETKSASCSEPGIESETCSVCNTVVATRDIETIEHSCDLVVTKEATENEKGIKEYICKVCGASTGWKEYEWCNHDYIAEVTEPTCETSGYTTYTCSLCGDSYVSDKAEATGHSYTTSVVEPKCEKIGYTLYACSKCGNKYITDKKTALEHNYVTERISSTCTQAGGILHKCTLCGDSYMTDEVGTIPHMYSSKIKKATCTEGGYTVFTCEYCNDSFKADETPALGHNYIVKTINGTCTEGTYAVYSCSVCNDEYKDVVSKPKDHTFGEWIIRKPADEGHAGVKFRVCSVCTFEETAQIPITDHEHTVGEWVVETEPTCDVYGVKVQRCTVCNEVVSTEIIEAKGHQYSSKRIDATCTEDGYTEYTCSVCNNSYKDDIQTAVGHETNDWIVEKEPTCTKDGLRYKTCDICKEKVEEEIIEKLGHRNTTWIDVSKPTCTEVGVKKLLCNDCNEYITTEVVAALGHKYQSEVVSPTCEEKGYTKYECFVCGYNYISDYVDSLGHELVHHNGKEAACETDGWLAYDTCERCDYNTFKSIAAKGHVINDGEITKAATCTSDGEMTYSCSICSKVLRTETIEKLSHSDLDADGFCDTCGEKLYIPIAYCKCACHKKGIAKLFFKIGLIFQKIFKKNRICKCGVWHY